MSGTSVTITFKGDVVTGDLPLAEAKLVCVPAKPHYNVVDLCFKAGGCNAQVAAINTSWLSHDDKKALGYEIEKRWNGYDKAIELLSRSVNEMEWRRDNEPGWNGADDEHLSECKAFLGC